MENFSVCYKPPTFRSKPSKSVEEWRMGKKVDDNADGLWRVHDKLYDLINFIPRHPGGQDWIQLTQGMDITELFETHHLTSKPEILLHNFYVCEAKARRNCRITFIDDGFYKTLRKKIADQMINVYRDGVERSKRTLDAFLVVTILSAILAARMNSVTLSMLSGVALGLLTLSAHNFLHQKDNWRMYCFNLSGLNYREWRVSHVLSHHMYPNTVMDFEVFRFEPFVKWFPIEKTFADKMASVVLLPLLWLSLPTVMMMKRSAGYLRVFCFSALRRDHLLSFLLPNLMYMFGKADLIQVIKAWLIIISMSSLLFGLLTSISGTHHVKCYHEGDSLPSSMDFGIIQLIANIDRADLKKNHFMNLTQFGHNTLHHLFPSIDVGLLPQLSRVLLETCREFEVKTREQPWHSHMAGHLNLIQRTKPLGLHDMKL